MENSIVWITLINKGYIEYTKNFLESCSKASIQFYLNIFCVDKDSFEEFINTPNCTCYNVLDILENQNLTSEVCLFGTNEFKKIVFLRLNMIQYMMKKYEKTPVGIIDMDIVLFKDINPLFLEALEKFPYISIFSQCDENKTCSNPSNCKNICNGLAVFRNNQEIFDLFNYTSNDIEKSQEDQFFLNAQIQKKNIPHYVFEKHILCNGTFLGIQEHNPIQLHPDAVSLHFNWLVGYQKKESMKEQKLWFFKQD